MKMVTGVLVLLFVFMAGNVLADGQSVYFNLGLGGASASYPSELEVILDVLDEVPGVSHAQVGIDLGLYFPTKPGSVLGFAISGIGDRYEDDSSSMQFNQYLYAASYRYYTTGEVGKGLFLRGDVGLARLVWDFDGFANDIPSDSGMGFLVGGGYSFQISGGTWFSINADYTSKSIESETYGGITIGGAFLF